MSPDHTVSPAPDLIIPHRSARLSCLRAARNARRLTQAELADRASISLPTVGEFERGNIGLYGILLRLAAALNVSMDYLNGHEEFPRPDLPAFLDNEFDPEDLVELARFYEAGCEDEESTLEAWFIMRLVDISTDRDMTISDMAREVSRLTSEIAARDRNLEIERSRNKRLTSECEQARADLFKRTQQINQLEDTNADLVNELAKVKAWQNGHAHDASWPAELAELLRTLNNNGYNAPGVILPSTSDRREGEDDE